MDGFKLFFQLNEIHAHLLSQQPKYVIGYRGNVWVFDDNFLPRMANIPKIIQAQNPQQLSPADRITNVNALLKWTRDVGDAVIGTIKNGKLVATFADHPITATSPLVPKIQRVLAKNGIQVEPETNQAPGIGQQKAGTPQIAYHGTNSNHIGNILRNGLQPAVAQSNWGVQHDDKTFLTTDFHTAQLHAVNSLKKHQGNGQPVVVAFKITDPSRLGADFDVDRESTPTQQRPSQYKHETRDVKYGVSPMQASNHAGLFSFRGTLTPQMIHSVYTTDPGNFSKFRQMTPEEMQHFKKFNSYKQTPDFSKNYPAPNKPQAAQKPEDWSVGWHDDDDWSLSMNDEPQYPQAIPMQQHPQAIPMQQHPQATPQTPQAQPQQRPWWKKWFGG